MKRNFRQYINKLLFITIIFINGNVVAQQFNLNGQVLDSLNDLPVQYASIEIFDRDSVRINGTVTDQKGRFTINGLKSSTPVIKVNAIGYRQVNISPINFNKNNKDWEMPAIHLPAKPDALQEVLVKGRKNTASIQLDKQVVDAKRFQTAANGTGLDLLQKMPSVTVTGEGEISLRGSTGFIVLVNGKASNRAPAEILSQLPANSIDNVEIITSPSAKYDADGKSGIINIITKNDLNTGLSVSGNSMFGGSDPLRFSGDLLLNYNAKKWSVYAAVDYRRYDINGHRVGVVRTLYKDTLTWLPSDGVRNYLDHQYSFRIGASYNPDAHNNFNIAFYSGYKETGRTANLHYIDHIKTPVSSGLFDKDFSVPLTRFFNKNLFVRSGEFKSASVDYAHSFANKSKLALSGIYEYSVLGGPLDNINEIEGTNKPYVSEHSDESAPLNGVRLQADYSLPVLKKGKLSGGVLWKYFNEDASFVYERKDSLTGSWFKDPLFNDEIKVTQQIKAGYIQFENVLNNLTYNAGIRAEQMDRKLADALTAKIYSYNQLNLFPSVQALWALQKQQKIRLGYNRRIDWPAVKSLSPFQNHRHEETIEVGDPALKPEIADVAELSYSRSWKKISLTATAYISKVQNKVFRTNEIYSRIILLRNYTNAGNSTSTGLKLSTDIPIAGWWRFYLSGNLYNFNVKGTVKGVSVDRTSVNYNTSANTSIDISRRLKFQWDVNYVSKTVTSQGEDSHFMLSNAGLKYSLWKSKGTLGLQLNNIFNTNIQTVTTEQANFYSSTDYIKYDRVLQLSLGFRINESNKKVKTIKTEYGEKEF